MDTDPSKSALCVCICTYQRSGLLLKLVGDIAAQTLKPKALIIVEGRPSSEETKDLLQEVSLRENLRIIYIASRHPNLAYQRYLGWSAAVQQRAEVIAYFDDDLRFQNPNILEVLKNRLLREHLAGLTAETKTGSPEKFKNHALLREQREAKKDFFSRIARRFGAGRNLRPGALSPSGHRIPPPLDEKESAVSWLQGRVMVYDLRFLTQECFSNDLFALTHVRCGLGEDTFLSHRVASKGELRLLRDLDILHPDEDMPNSYPIRPFAFGFATAYSRRLLNDDYRFPERAKCKDRQALLFSYAGHILTAFAKFIFSPSLPRLLFFLGYSKGAFKGVFFPPRAETLSPGVEWRKDAESDLAKSQEFD